MRLNSSIPIPSLYTFIMQMLSNAVNATRSYNAKCKILSKCR